MWPDPLSCKAFITSVYVPTTATLATLALAYVDNVVLVTAIVYYSILLFTRPLESSKL